MSIVLASGLEAKVHPTAVSGPGREVRIGDKWMSLEDLLSIAHYALIITDLAPDDPRRQFVKSIKEMREIPGYGVGAVRFFTPVEPIRGEVAPFS